jgi:lysophospholipase L1-like esterase
VRRILRLLVWIGIALLVAESGLQLASLFARDRAAGWRAGARYRVLCVGDSHTYGVLVEPEEAYPAQLQALLDGEAPGVYSVVNLGVPGMNTGQVLERLPLQVDRYRPDLVIVWAGINDAWNRAADELETSRWAALDGLASHLRLYRLTRVLLHDLRLERDVVPRADEAARATVEADRVGPDTTFTIRHGGRVEHVQHRGGEARSSGEIEARAERNYDAMARWARAAGVHLVFVAYPVQWATFATANRAMLRAAARQGVPVLESRRVLSRLPQEERRLLWGAHPRAPVYREIARDLVPIVVGSLRGS